MKLPAGSMMSAMRSLTSPRRLFLAGAVCVILGFVLPLLIVIGAIQNSFAFSFFIYILQFAGMIMGVIAAAGISLEDRIKREKPKKQDEDEQESTVGWME